VVCLRSVTYVSEGQARRSQPHHRRPQPGDPAPETQLNGKNNEIATLKKSLDDKIYQLDGLRGALGLDGDDVLPMPWKPGPPEARKRIVGHVADVSSKYGYIAIDLGTESTVEQELGNKVGEINVNLTPGLEMVVSRGDISPSRLRISSRRSS
ncbi:MAG: hypothetical protein V8T86_06485, partial [Victivallis sp.]